MLVCGSVEGKLASLCVWGVIYRPQGQNTVWPASLGGPLGRPAGWRCRSPPLPQAEPDSGRTDARLTLRFAGGDEG